MGVDINWSALQPVDIGGAFQQGMEHGRQRRVESETRNALSAYAKNPDDQSVFANLAQYNPQLAIQIRQDQTKRAQQAHDEGVKVIGQAALAIANLPEDQRSAAWDDQITRLSTRFPAIAEYKGQYSPQALSSVLAEAGLTKDAMEQGRLRITAVQPGGSYVAQDSTGRIYDSDSQTWQTLGGAQPAPQVTTPASPAPVPVPQVPPTVVGAADVASVRRSMGEEGFRRWKQEHNVVLMEDLQAEAQDAIARGADPAAVEARLRQMMGAR